MYLQMLGKRAMEFVPRSPHSHQSLCTMAVASVRITVLNVRNNDRLDCQLWSDLKPRQTSCPDRAGWLTSCSRRCNSASTKRGRAVQTAAAQEPVAFVAKQSKLDETSCETFYDILGVSWTANNDQLKQAYKQLMREAHPDLNAQEDEAAHIFCMVVNDIYDTLKDTEKRAAYDAIMGISGLAKNPFRDQESVRDHVFVDEITCIGCKNCTNVAPNTYELEEDFGRARAIKQLADTPQTLQESIDTCPVDCIHWVSAEQLAVLESTLSRLDRFAVWMLMTDSGRGLGVDVFNEAQLAWEKRQAGIRARREAAEAQSTWASWGAAAGVATGSAAAAGSQTAGPEVSPRDPKVAAAQAAANAARRWRDVQRKRRQPALLSLSSGDEL